MNPLDRKPMRVWPGVALAALQIFSWFALPVILPEQGFLGFLISLAGGLLIILWWLFFSRAPWSERMGYLLLMIVAVGVTSRFIHVSVLRTSMGYLYWILSVILVPFAFALAAAISSRWATKARRSAMVAGILLACGVFTLLRNEGVAGYGFQFKWRWSQTPEERLLAQGGEKPIPPPLPVTPATPVAEEKPSAPVGAPARKAEAAKSSSAPTPPVVAEWPGFRGAKRDSVISGVRLETNWVTSPPKELWRRAVGPGWSSFAVRDDLIYTQEQRGDAELVSCYNLKTGTPVWEHRDAVRFWEANAGAGPRGTPTIDGNRIYAFGATGLLKALDADTGATLWTRDVAKDAEKKVPYWGFASSPLVLGETVIVAASGRLVAYDAASGNVRWLGPNHSGSYASPHLLMMEGVAQVALLTGDGITSVAPADGSVLWEHAWSEGGATMLQPGRTESGDLLLTGSSMSGGVGIRRVSVAHGESGWSVKEQWTSRGLKPYFNDFVVHKGHAYGFDGSILSCIELEKGERKWKGGRYGQGQLVLLAEQDVLLVISEEGELALVSATPDQFKEIGRAPALDGKTWNHPVIVGSTLLVRNDREMAAFRLSLVSGPTAARK